MSASTLEDWGFIYTPEIVTPDGRVFTGEPVHNKVPGQGIEHMAGLILGTSPLIGSWYIGLFESNYFPGDATKSSDLPAIECTAYSAATRDLWTPSSAGGVIDNIDDKAEFEMTQGKRIYGAFLCAASAKGSGSGPLFSIARFDEPLDPKAGSTVRLRIATVLVSN